QLQRRQDRRTAAVTERPDDPAGRVDAQARAAEAAVQEPVVRRLDARLADQLAGLRAPVAVRPDLVRLDLAEQAEELAAEPALRVAPHGQRLDPQARVGAGTLLEEEGKRGGRPGDHDRGRVRRAGDGVLEALDERAERNARALRQALELQQALVVRTP